MRELAAYHGDVRVGAIKIADNGNVRALDQDPICLGSFQSVTEASAAIELRRPKEPAQQP
jgi:hypothetical protein